MSGDRLRKAATELRHYAENATPGVWKLWGMTVMADQGGTSNVDTAVDVARTSCRDEHGKPRTWDAEVIRLMQPRTALVLADFLEDMGLVGPMYDDTTPGNYARRLADLILGEQP